MEKGKMVTCRKGQNKYKQKPVLVPDRAFNVGVVSGATYEQVTGVDAQALVDPHFV